jgi:hypothetical protein
MLTGHTHIAINSRVDITTGNTDYTVPLNPVPVITAMGPAPGELRVATDPAGAVKSVQAVLQPDVASVGVMAPVLARVASFELSPDLLQNLPVTAMVSLTFEVTPEGLSSLAGLRVRSAAELLPLLDAPVLGDVLAFRLVDLRVGT